MVRDYGKIVEGGAITFAPSAVEVDGMVYIKPSAEQYAAATDGPWLPIRDDGPSGDAPEGQHWVRTGFYEPSDDGKHIRVKYVLEADPQPKVEDYDKAMEEHLVRERSERGYTTREPDMYLNSQVPRWAADARDWVAHRDAVMMYALQIMNDVAGGGTPPTLDEFTAGLPNIVWSYNEDENPVPVEPEPEPQPELGPPEEEEEGDGEEDEESEEEEPEVVE